MLRKITQVGVVLILAACFAIAALAEETLIRNATILTAAKGTVKNGSILIRDGKIAAVGKDLKAGPDARIIDATGKYVTPGIIDAHSHMAIDGGGNESTSPVTPQVRIQDVIRSDDVNLYRALAGGVTTINVLHGSANVIGGQNAVLKLKYGRPVEEMFFPGAPRGIKFALGENPKRSNRRADTPARFPATRMGIEATLRDAFTRARAYMREWEAYELKVKAAGNNDNIVPPRRDLELETLADILRGRIRVHAHCYRADEIVMLLNLADEFGFKIASLQHVLEGYKVAREIAAHGAGASTFADSWAYKVEAYDATPYNAALMARRGVRVSINSDSAERVRRLNLEAAKAIKYGGLSEEEALKTITLNPAWQLGIDDRVGSIEVGKDADLAIWSGHPFSVYSIAEMTIIDGEVFFDLAKDLERRKGNKKPAEGKSEYQEIARK